MQWDKIVVDNDWDTILLRWTLRRHQTKKACWKIVDFFFDGSMIVPATNLHKMFGDSSLRPAENYCGKSLCSFNVHNMKS